MCGWPTNWNEPAKSERKGPAVRCNPKATDRHGADARSRRRGATIAEFAVVCPVFFMLMFAGMEFSILSTIRSTANNAAYEAARKLVIPGAKADMGSDEAKRIMAVVGVRNLEVTVTPSVINDQTQEVTVKLDIPYDKNAIFTPLFTSGVVVTAQTKLRTERFGGVTN